MRTGAYNPDVMPNSRLQGKWKDFDHIVERVQRRTPTAASKLAKPIFRPGNVAAAMHHTRIKTGTRYAFLFWGFPCGVF